MSDALASALRSPRLQLVLRVFLGLYFVHASLDKIADPPAFARIVYQWQVLGPIPSNIVAVTLPWVELLAGLLLIVGIWKRDAAAVVAVMLGVFDPRTRLMRGAPRAPACAPPPPARAPEPTPEMAAAR